MNLKIIKRFFRWIFSIHRYSEYDTDTLRDMRAVHVCIILFAIIVTLAESAFFYFSVEKFLCALRIVFAVAMYFVWVFSKHSFKIKIRGFKGWFAYVLLKMVFGFLLLSPALYPSPEMNAGIAGHLHVVSEFVAIFGIELVIGFLFKPITRIDEILKERGETMMPEAQPVIETKLENIIQAPLEEQPKEEPLQEPIKEKVMRKNRKKKVIQMQLALPLRLN